MRILSEPLLEGISNYLGNVVWLPAQHGPRETQHHPALLLQQVVAFPIVVERGPMHVPRVAIHLDIDESHRVGKVQVDEADGELNGKLSGRRRKVLAALDPQNMFSS
jgi:hypothetical protein